MPSISKHTVLVLLAFQVGAFAGDGPAYEHPGGLHTQKQLDYVRRQIKSKKQPWHASYRQLRQKVYGWKGRKPQAMKDYHVKLYYGKGRKQHVQMRDLLGLDARVAYTSALLYKLDVNLGSKERKWCAEKAKQFLNNWAAVNKQVSGGDGRLVMSYNGTTFVHAAELLWDYPGWSDDEKKQFKKWLVQVLKPCTGGKWRNSNRGNWWLMGSMAINHLLEDRDGMAADIRRLAEAIDKQIEPDGRMPVELSRGRNSIWYTYFALTSLTTCVEIARNAEGVNYYTFEPPSGGSVKKAVDFLFQHGVKNPGSWPVKKAGRIMSPRGVGGAFMCAMGFVYEEKAFYQWSHPPVWWEGNGLAWVCPSLMTPESAVSDEAVNKKGGRRSRR